MNVFYRDNVHDVLPCFSVEPSIFKINEFDKNDLLLLGSGSEEKYSKIKSLERNSTDRAPSFDCLP